MKKLIPFGIWLFCLIGAMIYIITTSDKKEKPKIDKEEIAIIEDYKGDVVTEKKIRWSEWDQKSEYYFQIKIILKENAIGYKKISVCEYDFEKYDLGDTL